MPRSSTRLRPLLFLLLIASLAACGVGGGGSASPDAGDDPAADPDATDGEEGEDTSAAGAAADLRVTVWTGDEQQLALFDAIAEDYIAEHDDIASVTFESLPFEDYTTALTVQLAGGNPPDLGWIFESYGPEFIRSGVLTDVGPALTDDPDYAYDDVSEPAMELWTEGDEVYAFPFSTSPFGIFYNADAFADAGLEDPAELAASGDWTWEAAADAAEEIVASGAADTGLVVGDFDYQVWENLATVWRGWGADPWSEDGTTCTFADPEMVDAMTFFHELVFERDASPGPGTSNDFFAGEAGMIITQISRATLLAEDGFEWGIVPLPDGPAGEYAVTGQAGIGVFEAGPNTEAATNFLRFWTNEANSQDMAVYFPPPRQSLLTTEILGEANPLFTSEQLQSVVIDGIAEGRTKPSHPNFAQLQQQVRSELDALWAPDADVEAVLGDVCGIAEPLLQS